MLKKLVSITAAITMLFSLGISAFAETTATQSSIYLNGTQLELNASLQGDRIYLPLRSICESLGYTVEWSGADGGSKVTTTLDSTTYVIDIVNQTLTCGDTVQNLEPNDVGAACYVSDGRAYLDSVQFAELYVLEVTNDPGNSKVAVISKASKNDITLAVGDTYTLSLDGNPTTGYEWYYTIADSGILEESGSGYTSTTRDDSVVGAGGTYTWTFKALKAGTTTLTFKYYRSWLGESSAEKTLTYNVTVK